MADASINISAGTGTAIDTRTEGTNSHHRQVVVLGDPATNAGVAPVDATAGLKVDLGADNDVTVTGTVTANLSATDNGVLDNIEAGIDELKTQVDLVTTAINNTNHAEDTAHSSTDLGVMALAVRQDTQADFGADGDYVPLSIDADGALRVSGGGGGTQYAEDAAHVSGNLGTMALAVRQDTQVDFGADGDYVPLSIDADGRARVVLAGVTVTDGAPQITDNALVVGIHPDSVNGNGQATFSASAPVVLAKMSYETVGASVTAQVLGGSGATGDYLSHVTVIPATTGAGLVTILDNATSIPVFISGTLPSLVPFTVYIGANSASGAWKVTTGANVSCIAVGNFT